MTHKIMDMTNAHGLLRLLLTDGQVSLVFTYDDDKKTPIFLSVDLNMTAADGTLAALDMQDNNPYDTDDTDDIPLS